jgi:hypothetical protein
MCRADFLGKAASYGAAAGAITPWFEVTQSAAQDDVRN